MFDVLPLFAILFVFLYLMIIRPQRQQQRKHLEMIANLKPGDEVITSGGLYGDIVEVLEDRVSLEISEDIEVEVAKRAIATVVPAEEFEARAELEPVAAAQEDTRQA